MKNYLFSILVFLSCFCHAQESSFKLLRYDEDYASLSSDTALSWYQRLKFNPLSKKHSSYLSMGGEVRYQYFYFENQDWGKAPKDRDGFLLSRFLGHVDYHQGKHFRAFVQLQSSFAGGQVATPSPVDQNILDLHQAFVDIEAKVGQTQKMTLRIGRQELSYGSQRLISVREAPNNRQSFDGAKIMFSTKTAKIDLLYSHYVPAKPGIFDDSFSHVTRLWGAYATFTQLPLLKNADFYYLGLNNKNAVYDDGAGTETRHSVGTRIWDAKSVLQYDLEGLYQFGHFAGKPIAAWTLSTNLSYQLMVKDREILLGLKTNAISGDRHYGDGQLNTLNPLFPKGAYLGLAALIGPYNLLDVHPYLEYSLNKKVILALDYDLFWRMNRNDGIYAVNGKLLYSGRSASDKHIGKQLGGEIRYSPNKYLSLRQEITWFNAGEYLKQAGPGKDILMFGSTITFKF